MNSSKVYVDVDVRFSIVVDLIPLSFVWDDGRRYEIDRINDIRMAASLKAGGAGLRYTCIVAGKESHLYYESDNRWFMERK